MSEKRTTKLCIFSLFLMSIITLICYGIINGMQFGKYSGSGMFEPMDRDIILCKKYGEKPEREFWRTVDLLKNDIPSEIKNKSWSIILKQNDILINNTIVHYRSVQPAGHKKDGISVLLLHGQSFSSATWENLGTLRLLGRLGYYSVAIDLPGFGDSASSIIHDKGHFLRKIIEGVGITKPIIVSPSMSGVYSMPYILQYWETLVGFVPISPVNTRVLNKKEICNKKGGHQQTMDKVCQSLLRFMKSDVPDLNCIQVPTMVVFGQNDPGRNSALLCQLPWSQGIEIPQGNHAAYLDDPELWHKALYNFLQILEITHQCK